MVNNLFGKPTNRLINYKNNCCSPACWLIVQIRIKQFLIAGVKPVFSTGTFSPYSIKHRYHKKKIYILLLLSHKLWSTCICICLVQTWLPGWCLTSVTLWGLMWPAAPRERWFVPPKPNWCGGLVVTFEGCPHVTSIHGLAALWFVMSPPACSLMRRWEARRHSANPLRFLSWPKKSEMSGRGNGRCKKEEKIGTFFFLGLVFPWCSAA